jgi:hypothetical protein
MNDREPEARRLGREVIGALLLLILCITASAITLAFIV